MDSNIVGTIDQETLDKNKGVYKIDKIGKYVVTEDLIGSITFDSECDMNEVIIDYANHSISLTHTQK